MLVPVIANCAQVIIRAFSTFPSDANDRLLSTSITHSPIMLDTCGRKTKRKKKTKKLCCITTQTSVAHHHNLKPCTRKLTIKKGCCWYSISLYHWGEKIEDFASYLQLSVCSWNILSSLSLKNWESYVCFLPSIQRRERKWEIF